METSPSHVNGLNRSIKKIEIMKLVKKDKPKQKVTLNHMHL